jgi:hypothetical protein
MHAIPVPYKGWILLPLAVGSAGSFASMLVLRAPDGHHRALGSLGDFATEKEACECAIKYGRTTVDKQHYKKNSSTRRDVADATLTTDGAERHV